MLRTYSVISFIAFSCLFRVIEQLPVMFMSNFNLMLSPICVYDLVKVKSMNGCLIKSTREYKFTWLAMSWCTSLNRREHYLSSYCTHFDITLDLENKINRRFPPEFPERMDIIYSGLLKCSQSIPTIFINELRSADVRTWMISVHSGDKCNAI